MEAHQPRGKALKMDGAQTVRLYSTMGTKWVFDPWVEEREVFEEERTWVRLENTLVQILVVVVITKLRTFWTEVENGFRWRAFRSEWVDPKRFVKHDKKWDGFKFLNPSSNWKGKRLTFRYLAKDEVWSGNSLSGGFSFWVLSNFFLGYLLRWRKRTLRLGRKEGVGTSALFKRKKETFSRKGEWVVEREGGLPFFFFQLCILRIFGANYRILMCCELLL